MGGTTNRLEALIDAWRMQGSPEQESFPWARSRYAWQALGDDFGIKIDYIPDLIDRQFLWSLNATQVPVEKIFLAVMIWGYGDIGYGPFRVRQMFESPNFVDAISTARDLCSNHQILDAYACLKESKIRQLGPSFGTKALAFFHDRNDGPAILDSVVAKWCNKYARDYLGEVPINAEVWSLKTYSRYMAWITKMSTSHSLPASSIEQLIFSDGYTTAN